MIAFHDKNQQGCDIIHFLSNSVRTLVINPIPVPHWSHSPTVQTVHKSILYGNFLKFIGVDVHQGVQRVSRQFLYNNHPYFRTFFIPSTDHQINTF